jgi:hypothetical protein
MSSACRRWKIEPAEDSVNDLANTPSVLGALVAVEQARDGFRGYAFVADEEQPYPQRVQRRRRRGWIGPVRKPGNHGVDPRESVAATQASPDGRSVRGVHAARGRGREKGRGPRALREQGARAGDLASARSAPAPAKRSSASRPASWQPGDLSDLLARRWRKRRAGAPERSGPRPSRRPGRLSRAREPIERPT